MKSSAVRAPFTHDLNAAIGAGALRPIKQTGSLRNSLTKKEMKEVEKKEKKAAKEAEKKAKKEAKKEKRTSSRRDKKEKSSSSKSGTKIRTSVSPTPEQRYTTDSANLPTGFDPASIRTALTPLATSKRSGSVSAKQEPVVTSGGGSGQTTDIVRINISTGEMSRGEKGDGEATRTKPHLPRSLSDGGLAKLVEVDSNEGDESQDTLTSLGDASSPMHELGGVHESLIRALSSEMLHAKKTGYDKRQSYISMQMLANDVSGLNFDFGGLDNDPLDSLGSLMRSNSVGPHSDRPSSEASSIYSETSLRNSTSTDSSSSDDDEDDEDAESGSEAETETSSVASSSTCLSSSYASHASLSSSALLSNMDETEVDMHRRAIESGAQVELVRKIGKGASGVVWLGLLDGKPVAVKQIELREVSQKRSFEMRKSIKQEVELLQTLNCVHVVRYFGMFASKAQQQVTLIMELVAGLSVTAFVVDRVKLPEPFAAFVIQQVLTALQFLEENKIVHRDVKPDNLLMNARGVVKMIDFGTAAQLLGQDCRRSTVGTPWYCAPEVIRSEDYSHPADIWSLGCTLIELLTGKPPYDDLADVACLFKMAEGQTPPLPSHIEADCLDFLKSCLHPNPSTRSTATQLLEHPWILKAMKEHDTIAEEIVKAIDSVLANEELRIQK